jgi:hypothetical protein
MQRQASVVTTTGLHRLVQVGTFFSYHGSYWASVAGRAPPAPAGSRQLASKGAQAPAKIARKRRQRYIVFPELVAPRKDAVSSSDVELSSRMHAALAELRLPASTLPIRYLLGAEEVGASARQGLPSSAALAAIAVPDMRSLPVGETPAQAYTRLLRTAPSLAELARALAQRPPTDEPGGALAAALGCVARLVRQCAVLACDAFPVCLPQALRHVSAARVLRGAHANLGGAAPYVRAAQQLARDALLPQLLQIGQVAALAPPELAQAAAGVAALQLPARDAACAAVAARIDALPQGELSSQTLGARANFTSCFVLELRCQPRF